jgi:hypothetical protein
MAGAQTARMNSGCVALGAPISAVISSGYSTKSAKMPQASPKVRTMKGTAARTGTVPQVRARVVRHGPSPETEKSIQHAILAGPSAIPAYAPPCRRQRPGQPILPGATGRSAVGWIDSEGSAPTRRRLRRTKSLPHPRIEPTDGASGSQGNRPATPRATAARSPPPCRASRRAGCWPAAAPPRNPTAGRPRRRGCRGTTPAPCGPPTPRARSRAPAHRPPASRGARARGSRAGRRPPAHGCGRRAAPRHSFHTIGARNPSAFTVSQTPTISTGASAWQKRFTKARCAAPSMPRR